ncbi:MAG: hypothetical protein Q9227_003536 [Pyrenula ochraceoflavens]
MPRHTGSEGKVISGVQMVFHLFKSGFNMSAAPTIPPRPTRHQQAAASGASKLPDIPPRPLRKHLDPSPSQEHHTQSPLNDLPSTNLGRVQSNLSSSSLPPRPPSVTLPSIGQEGSEYADIETIAKSSAVDSEPTTYTRNSGGDMPMHAPKPSLPQSSAKAQVQAVTRTDSNQASALGFGPPQAHEDTEPSNRSIRSKASFSRPGSTASQERRRGSIAHDDEHGPAELGMRVPINPALGDVQAPSPAPTSLHAGEPRRHARTKSGRSVFLPTDSYGLHAHGAQPMDKFDKEWYAKHPEAYAQDESQGHYAGIGSGRGEWAMSSDELNKIVRDTASRGAGFGTTPAVQSYPDEQIGYLASEQYSRMASPAHEEHPETYLRKMQSNHSQPAIESPLRKTNFPEEFYESKEANKSKASIGAKSDVTDNDTDDDVIHVDEPSRRMNKVTGGTGTIEETEDLGPQGGNTAEEGGWVDEHGYGVPILASDEVAKEVGGEYMQPAVSPLRDRRGSAFMAESGYTSGDLTPGSRPSSRPGSIHGITGLARFVSRHDEREDTHTPLEDVEEYEPLFPEEEQGKQKPLTAAERFKKRPDVLKRRFPSQDVWEDTPDSALQVTTVSTPDLVKDEKKAETAAIFETPEQEAARKGEPTEEEKAKLEPRESYLAKSKFAPHLRDDMPSRPGMQPRFPSQDVWEDSPDSVHLITTVGSQEESQPKSPPDTRASKPSIPPRPVGRSKLGEGAAESSIPAKQPPIPARPPKRLHQVPPADAKLTEISPVEKKAPIVPERPKPQIPTRPAKRTSGDSEPTPHNQDAVDREIPGKVKPSIPARPAGNAKFAAIKAGFLSNLEKQLQSGPQGPPPKEKRAEKEEVESVVEKGPLADARKGRARGPQRRKPAISPSAILTTEAAFDAPKMSICQPKSLWHITSNGALTVTEDDISIAEPMEAAPSGMPAPTILKNVAGEAADPFTSNDATPRSEKANPLDKPPSQLVQQVSQESNKGDDLASSAHDDTPSLTDEIRQEQVDASVQESTESEKKGSSDSLSDKALEEMTARADNKVHAAEEGASIE